MGAAMAGHLLAKDTHLTVHSRTKVKAHPLLEQGACWAESPAAVAQVAEVVFTMVGFPYDVREVYFGKQGLLANPKAGTVFVDMTTTEPRLAKEIFSAAKAKGCESVDAPVSGGDIGAQHATLSIMVGGEQAVADRLLPLFSTMGKTIVYQGPAGSGQHTKLCNQIVIASTMIGVCESLLYGFKAGLSLNTMLQSISGGAAACWTLTNLAPRMVARNFDPGFVVDHFVKDMGIALEEAKRMRLVLPGLALAHQLYISVQAHGHGHCGTHALLLALEAVSNTSLKPAALHP